MNKEKEIALNAFMEGARWWMGVTEINPMDISLANSEFEEYWRRIRDERR